MQEECSKFAKQSDAFYGKKIMVRNWLTCTEAKEIIQKYKFKTRGQYFKNYNKLKLKEKRIPKSVEALYKNHGWKGWRDFLGHNILSMQEVHETLLPLEELKKLVQKLGIKTYREYRKWSKNCKIKGVIMNPHQSYKRKGMWISYPDLFNYYKNEKGKYGAYEIIKKKAQELGIKSKNAWDIARKADKIPRGIPKNPTDVYKKDWISWGDWLGTYGVKKMKGMALDGTKFWKYKKSSNFLRKLKVQSKRQFNELYRAGKIPQSIPRWPDGVYKEWKGYPKYLGTNRVSRKKGFKYGSYNEAKAWARKHKIKGLRGWKKAFTSRQIPWKFPAHPYQTYKKNWISWNDFLGTNKNPWRNKNFKWRSFEETKKYVRKLGIKTQKEYMDFCKSGKKPIDIPVNPNKIYGRKF